jgi:hypothetical protein
LIAACLPPREFTRPRMPLPPNALFELFQMWTLDPATQHRILVTSPAKLYGFPN